MNEQQPEFTLDELLKVKPQSPADLTEEDLVWVGGVPGQRLPDNFMEMDADALRQLFITSMVPIDVWSKANELFDDNERDAIHWLCDPAFGLGGQRPVDAIRTPKGKEAVLKLIGQLSYGVIP